MHTKCTQKIDVSTKFTMDHSDNGCNFEYVVKIGVVNMGPWTGNLYSSMLVSVSALPVLLWQLPKVNQCTATPAPSSTYRYYICIVAAL